jgi:hypothetical protein
VFPVVSWTFASLMGMRVTVTAEYDEEDVQAQYNRILNEH